MAKKDDIVPEVNYADIEEDLRELTGIGDGDDKKLRAAYNAASRYANGIIAGAQVDKVKFEAIYATALVEMTILRFNRLEEEGMKQRTQDGESITWIGDIYKPWDDKLSSVIIDDEAQGWIVKTYAADDYDAVATYETYHPFFGQNMWFYQSDAQAWRTQTQGSMV